MPDSPVISTVVRVGPTLRINVLTACIGGLWPTSESRSPRACSCRRNAWFSCKQPAKPDQPVELGEQLLEDHRLHQVVMSPALKCGDGVLDRGVGRDHDEQVSGRTWSSAVRARVEAVGAGKLDVAEHDVGLERLDQGQGRRQVAAVATS